MFTTEVRNANSLVAVGSDTPKCVGTYYRSTVDGPCSPSGVAPGTIDPLRLGYAIQVCRPKA